MSHHAFTDVLQRLAQEARPARLPTDLWSRGRRRRRRRLAFAAAAVLLLAALAVPAIVLADRRPAVPADDQPAVPTRVDLPLPFQSTVQSAPAGPASMIVTGPGGFNANDLFGYDDRAIVVGRDGSSRWIQEINSFNASESLLLSPDGRYLAGGWGIEGATVSDADLDISGVVVDLTTGDVHTHRFGRPIAWTPDGRSLLTVRDFELVVADPVSGAMIRQPGGGIALSDGAAVAFSPDARQVALQVGQSVVIVDLAAKTRRTVVDLGDRGILAGPGGWTPDGRIAIWRATACAPSCSPGGPFRLELTYVDAVRGTPVDGPRFDTFDAWGARLLGWQSDGAAVVVQYGQANPVPPDVAVNLASPFGGRAYLVALRPGGGTTTLVELPKDASRVEVARNLLDRFGAPPPSPLARFADWLGTAATPLTVISAIIATSYGLILATRRRRTGSWRRRSARSLRAPDLPRRF